MTEKQENNYSMKHAVEQVLNDNTAIWTPNTGFAAIKNAYSGKLLDIFNKSQEQDAIITGFATNKKVLKRTLVDFTSPIASALIVVANQANDNVLLEAVNYSHSDLLNTRDNQIGQRCQNIHDLAVTHSAALTLLGIPAPVVATQQTALNTYILKLSTPAAAKAAKKAVSNHLRTLFKETDDILNIQLDNLIKQYKVSNTEFHDAYQTARKIHDLGATHTRMNITVKDENNLVIQGATASLLQNNLIIYHALSDAAGKIKFPKIKPGIFNLKVQKTNFITKTETGILFQAGKLVKRTVTLVPGVSSGGITIIREGTVLTGNTANLDTTAINPHINSTVLAEITQGGVRIYAASAVDGVPGTVFWDIPAGTNILKSIIEFGGLIGADETKQFIRIQCLGPTDAHFKFTFNNLEP